MSLVTRLNSLESRAAAARPPRRDHHNDLNQITAEHPALRRRLIAFRRRVEDNPGWRADGDPAAEAELEYIDREVEAIKRAWR